MATDPIFENGYPYKVPDEIFEWGDEKCGTTKSITRNEVIESVRRGLVYHGFNEEEVVEMVADDAKVYCIESAKAHGGYGLYAVEDSNDFLFVDHSPIVDKECSGSTEMFRPSEKHQNALLKWIAEN